MIRVAFVAPSFGEAEGQGRVNLEIARRLIERGARLDVYTSRLPTGGLPGARVRLAPRPFPIELLNQLLFVAWATLAVARRRYDVVHADGASLLSRADAVAAHMLHSVWREIARGREPGLRGLYRSLSNAINVRLERRAYRRARLVLANSERTADDLVRAIGVARDRIRVIPLGVDAARFHLPSAAERANARARLGAGPDELVAVLVGAVEPRKGVPQAVEAFAGIEGAMLVVVGDTRGGAIKREAAARRARVRFEEWPADPLASYFAADVLLHPAAYEPFGLSVLEGMACGLPAAVSPSAGVAPVAAEASIPVAPDPASIRRVIETLRDDPERRALMKKRAREIAAARTWDATAEAVLDAWTEVSG
ncbi:MAG TPA: glycosyltransferase family 4 protein [Actinomycetota bacterium]|nr:glycosyltransferase family 4 protein [Actinomycetota bacterium]